MSFGTALPQCVVADNVDADNSDASQIMFRIGTGGSAGTYLPIGSLIAESISGASGYHSDETYNEPNLIALAQRSTGSVNNVVDISKGLLEAGLAQADVVHWASTGTGPFNNEMPIDNLRFIATLYQESVHLIVRTESTIKNIRDLAGQRVSVGEQGSGTRLAILSLLAMFDMRIDSLKTVYLKTSDAIDRLRNNNLDAIIIVAGYPVEAVSSLITEGKARVIPVDGLAASVVSTDLSFFTIDSIPPNTYENAEPIPTLGVPAQLITNDNMEESLIYNITSMLWNEKTLRRLSNGHPKGKELQLETALSGTHATIHPGAERFYREQGLIND